MRPEWLEALAVLARTVGPPMVDACLARFPHARRVLDLGEVTGSTPSSSPAAACGRHCRTGRP